MIENFEGDIQDGNALLLLLSEIGKRSTHSSVVSTAPNCVGGSVRTAAPSASDRDAAASALAELDAETRVNAALGIVNRFDSVSLVVWLG